MVDVRGEVQEKLVKEVGEEEQEVKQDVKVEVETHISVEGEEHEVVAIELTVVDVVL